MKMIGVAVSNGIAIGKSICVDYKFNIINYQITKEDITRELKRLENVIIVTIAELNYISRELTGNKNQRDILDTHKMILEDPEMINNIKKILQDELVTLEKALDLNLQAIKEQFSEIEDEYFSARIIDYQDVTSRLLKKLYKTESEHENWTGSILVAQEITPSQVLEAYKNHVAGLISIHGSRKSHSAILARSLIIPMVMGLDDAECDICPQEVIVDGKAGIVIVSPSRKEKDKYQKDLTEINLKNQELALLADKESVTKDGKKIPLFCNIEIPEEIAALERMNIEGIGLFRTEFLYLDRQELPDEEEQFQIYKEVAEKLSPKPVIIRTIDLGGDKIARSLKEVEMNPNLGLRGIRLSFKYLDLFKVQLRAILRAAVHGKIKIMFPMVSSVSEIDSARNIILECQKELEADKIEYQREIEIGTMIEVPSAALRAKEIAAKCDFLSIGTNDLVQYTLAVDRNNDLVAEYYNEMDPSVLYLIQKVCQSAHEAGIKVAVCGEMASQEQFTSLLLGLGVDELSTSPANYNEIKKKILQLDTKECEKYAVSLL